MDLHMYIHIRKCKYIRVRKYIYVYVCIHTYMYAHKEMCIYTHVYVHLFLLSTNMYVCIYIKNIKTESIPYNNFFVCVCVYTHIYLHLYEHTHTKKFIIRN